MARIGPEKWQGSWGSRAGRTLLEGTISKRQCFTYFKDILGLYIYYNSFLADGSTLHCCNRVGILCSFSEKGGEVTWGRRESHNLQKDTFRLVAL